jgi:tetratricopeptide (TPR) repeat protein
MVYNTLANKFICYILIYLNKIQKLYSINAMRTHIKNRLFNSFFTMFCIFQLNGIAVASSESENLFNSGLTHYENEKYGEAIKQLENAIKLEPEVAKYHHILAVSYGREAEKTNWFRAMNYAKKTLTHLELAAKLDKNNLEILDDLMDFYREAPGFLGGNTKKANEIEDLIEKLSLESSYTAKFE